MTTGLAGSGSLSLQQQAVQRVRSTFGELKKEDTLFTQAQNQQDAVSEILKAVKEKYGHRRSKRRALVEKFERYTQWLQNFSDIVDTLAQTQAGIGCPVWAPIKLVLQVSLSSARQQHSCCSQLIKKDLLLTRFKTSQWHSDVAEHILSMIQIISNALPRLDLYEQLKTDASLQAALLNVYSDVLDFSLRVLRFVKRNTLGNSACPLI